MTDAISVLSKPGDTLECTARGILIVLQRTIDGGYTRSVWAGPTRVDSLSKSYTDERTARAQARLLASALKEGMSVWAFAADAIHAEQDVLAAANRVVDEALQVACAAPVGPASDRDIAKLQAAKAAEGTDELAERIRADWDTRDRQARADRDRQDADVAQIMADSRGFRGTVPQGVRRQVRPTLAGAHLADLTAAQLDAIHGHRGGTVHLEPGVTRPMLASIARKGYGVLNYQPGLGRRQVIESLTLNARGLAQAVTA